MSIQSALNVIETRLRETVELPAHELRQLLNDIDAHLPRHLTDEVIMAAIDDVSAGISSLQTNVTKLIALLSTDSGGQSAAAAALAATDAQLGTLATTIGTINASIEAALNPAPAPVADPNGNAPTGGAPAGSVLG